MTDAIKTPSASQAAPAGEVAAAGQADPSMSAANGPVAYIATCPFCGQRYQYPADQVETVLEQGA